MFIFDICVLAVHISILLFQTTEPLWTKFIKNITWRVMNILYDFLFHLEFKHCWTILISSKKWSSKIYQRYVFFSPPEEYIHHFNSYMIFNTIKKIMFYYQVTLVCFSAKSRSIPGLHPTPDTRSTTHFTPGIKLLNMTYFYFHWLWSVQCLNCILNLYFVMGNNI